ncbi:hypothetical protein BOBR111200_20680 [Bordetella bronchialis]|uniref:Autotransporter n=2 Tax=Bordetella bronchialis TaxID=463025 RepID=A0A193FI71_9BORD|nr:hypothetical protein BAU06_11415 [Bordetella bronchialis]ANN71886.1 hypothetical protein BAU08_11615 [Bordetella bronchialis]
MEKIAAAILSFSLLCVPAAALAADPPRGTSPTKDATEGTCVGASKGDTRVGYIGSVGTSWFGTNNTTIAFENLSRNDYSIESSGYFTDTDEGVAQLTSLVLAYLMTAKVTIYCTGKNAKTGRDSFTYIWLGDAAVP